MPNQKTSSYDTKPYPRFPFPQSHPDRLAILGMIFGMEPTDIRSCRVLEIGCATGGNLVPMAEQLPGSQFFGFDLSQRQVDEANTWIAELRLTNIQVKQLDIVDEKMELGVFDYILCHGVYSWVPAESQASILDLISNHLSPNGVAYISYNTTPGWNVRGIVRDMMRFHTQGIDNTHDKIVQARQLLSFMVQNIAPTDPYGMLLKSEMDTLAGKADEYIEHEYFEDHNVPVCFHEFAASLTAHKLRYLCEADVESTFRGDVPSEALQTLERISGDEIRLEQYLDFLRNRTYRQSLVCHAHQPLRRALEPGMVDRCFLESLLVPTQSPIHFRNRFKPITLAIEDPVLNTSLRILSDLTKSDWVFSELVDEVQRRHSNSIDANKLRRSLLQAFASGHMEFHTAAPRYGYELSGTPQSSRCARSQSLLGAKVTSLSHNNVVLSDLDRIVLQSLDGSTRVDELLPKVQTALATGKQHVKFDGNSLQEAVQMSAKNLARMRLLFSRSILGTDESSLKPACVGST